MILRQTTLLLLVAATLPLYADLVGDVRATAEQGGFAKATSQIQSYEKAYGRTPESIAALSWLGRTALTQKRYDQANQYATETYKRVQAELRKRPLDREPFLPLALGAAIEVQAQILAAKSQRTEALLFLDTERKKFATTSIQARIQKNINLLSLVGKPAPALEGIILPKGKPTVLFFWAHWCPDCRAEAPILTQLKREFAAKGLVFLGPTQRYGYIGAYENPPPAVELAYIEKIRQEFYAQLIPAPPLVSEKNFLTYGVSTTPTLTLVDQRGIVRLYHPGPMKYPDLRAAILSVTRTPLSR